MRMVSPSLTAVSSGGRRWASAAAPIDPGRRVWPGRSASALHVVGVVVGQEDMCSRRQPLVASSVSRIGPGFGHVEHRRFAAFVRIVHEIGVIVRQTGDGHKLKGHCVSQFAAPLLEWPFKSDPSGTADRNAPGCTGPEEFLLPQRAWPCGAAGGEYARMLQTLWPEAKGQTVAGLWICRAAAAALSGRRRAGSWRCMPGPQGVMRLAGRDAQCLGADRRNLLAGRDRARSTSWWSMHGLETSERAARVRCSRNAMAGAGARRGKIALCRAQPRRASGRAAMPDAFRLMAGPTRRASSRPS